MGQKCVEPAARNSGMQWRYSAGQEKQPDHQSHLLAVFLLSVLVISLWLATASLLPVTSSQTETD